MTKKNSFVFWFLVFCFLIVPWSSFENNSLYGQQEKRFKPIPRVPIILDCQVNLPDRRGVPDVKVSLYEVLRGGTLRWIKSGETNTKGFCQIKVGKAFMNKRIKIVPKYGDYPEGRYFRPSPSEFQITEMHHSLFYTYTGPLPDLVAVAAEMVLDGTQSKGIVRVRVNNNGLAASGPFRIKVFYYEITGFIGFDIKKAVMDFEAITGRNSRVEEKEVFVSEPRVKLSEYLGSVEVDIHDSVLESDESNNRYVPPR